MLGLGQLAWTERWPCWTGSGFRILAFGGSGPRKPGVPLGPGQVCALRRVEGKERKERTVICWSSNKGLTFGTRVNVLPFSFFPPCLPLFLILFHTPGSHQAWGRRVLGKGGEVVTGRGKENFYLPLMTSLHLRAAGVSIF